MSIDPSNPGVDLFRHAERLRQILGPDPGAEPELAVVRQLYRFVLGIEPDYDNNGPESLLPPELRLQHVFLRRAGIHKHSRLVEIPLREIGAVERAGTSHPLASRYHAREPSRDGLVHQRLHAAQLLRGHEGPHRRVRIRRRAHARGDGFRLGPQEPHDGVEDPVLDDDPRAGDARLPAGDEAPERDPVHGELDVGAREHDQRRLAAQLGRVPRQIPARDGAYGASGRRAARHVDLAHERVLHEGSARERAVPR